MDINDLRSLSTVLVFISFILVGWWAFSPRRNKHFEEAANIPFADTFADEQHVEQYQEKQEAGATESQPKGQG